MRGHGHCIHRRSAHKMIHGTLKISIQTEMRRWTWTIMTRIACRHIPLHARPPLHSLHRPSPQRARPSLHLAAQSAFPCPHISLITLYVSHDRHSTAHGASFATHIHDSHPHARLHGDTDGTRKANRVLMPSERKTRRA